MGCRQLINPDKDFEFHVHTRWWRPRSYEVLLVDRDCGWSVVVPACDGRVVRELTAADSYLHAVSILRTSNWDSL